MTIFVRLTERIIVYGRSADEREREIERYTLTQTHTFLYINIYKGRERKRDRERGIERETCMNIPIYRERETERI